MIDEFGEANPAGAAEALGGDDRGASMGGLDWMTGVLRDRWVFPMTPSQESLRRYQAVKLSFVQANWS